MFEHVLMLNKLHVYTIRNINIKMTDVMEEKLNPSWRSTEESIVNQNSFRVLSILQTFVKQEK